MEEEVPAEVDSVVAGVVVTVVDLEEEASVVGGEEEDSEEEEAEADEDSEVADDDKHCMPRGILTKCQSLQEANQCNAMLELGSVGLDMENEHFIFLYCSIINLFCFCIPIYDECVN